MNIKNLNEKTIKDFAGGTIYSRGFEYYQNGQVLDLEYEETDKTISAEVEGNSDNYQVNISFSSNEIEADCDCPYDGYPCKHIVAVLLEFNENKSNYSIETKSKSNEKDSIMKNLNSLSKENLIDLISENMKKYPDFKRDLQLRYTATDTQTINSIKKQITSVFSGRNINYGDKSLPKKLEVFIKAVEKSDNKTKIEIYWSIAEEILEKLEEYDGMYDVPIEDTAIEVIEEIIELFKKDKTKLVIERKKIINELMKHYLTDCSISDNLYTYAEDLCLEKDDFKIIIEHIKIKASKTSYGSHYKDLLADLYEKIQDEASQLKTLENNLKYGSDYWKLAEYWIGKNDDSKALSIVLEGIKKGEGRKDELYEYMENIYLEQKNYPMLMKLLQDKISSNKFRYAEDFLKDSTYKLLVEYYKDSENYTGIKDLYNLNLKITIPDFKFYKEAKAFFKSEDFPEFEKKIIKKLTINTENYSFGVNSIDETLLKIYLEKNDYDSLFKIAKKSISCLQKYETKLIKTHHEYYLKEYMSQVKNLIAGRSREHYKNTIPYIKGIKKIYVSILKDDMKWREYITNIKVLYSKLKALQDELTKAGI